MTPTKEHLLHHIEAPESELGKTVAASGEAATEPLVIRLNIDAHLRGNHEIILD